MISTIALIASSQLGIETLEIRNSDRKDIYKVAVWDVASALSMAYKAGQIEAHASPIDKKDIPRGPIHEYAAAYLDANPDAQRFLARYGRWSEMAWTQLDLRAAEFLARLPLAEVEAIAGGQIKLADVVAQVQADKSP